MYKRQLFEGARRFAESGQATADLSRLRREREAVAEQVEERIRAAVHLASASLSRIDLSRQGAAASARNLELVRDAYARGAVSIIDLLDAQTAYLTARQNEANAVFRFLADVMAVERAVGTFTFLADEAEREAWLGDLRAWFETAEEQP